MGLSSAWSQSAAPIESLGALPSSPTTPTLGKCIHFTVEQGRDRMADPDPRGATVPTVLLAKTIHSSLPAKSQSDQAKERFRKCDFAKHGRYPRAARAYSADDNGAHFDPTAVFAVAAKGYITCSASSRNLTVQYSRWCPRWRTMLSRTSVVHSVEVSGACVFSTLAPDDPLQCHRIRSTSFGSSI